jgi:hypothetical protein
MGRMDAKRRYLSALASVTRGSALPYGYTITVWASGAVLSHLRGPPGIGAAFVFVLGAVGAFAAIGLGTLRTSSAPVEPAPSDLRRTGAVHIAAAGCGLAAATLTGLIPAGLIVWALGSFSATAVYLLVASIELLLAHRAGEKSTDTT